MDKDKISDKNVNICPEKNKKTKAGIIVTINYIDDKKNDENSDININKNKISKLSSISNKINFKPDKKKVSKLISISSNFSNIKFNEPLNLAMNKNDSFIHSIVNEMKKDKN